MGHQASFLASLKTNFVIYKNEDDKKASLRASDKISDIKSPAFSPWGDVLAAFLVVVVVVLAGTAGGVESCLWHQAASWKPCLFALCHF